MKTTSIVATLLLFVVTGSAHAENIQVIDDFSQGGYHSPAYQGPNQTVTVSQTGDPRFLVGGNRSESLYLCTSPQTCASFNPFSQFSSYAIGPYNGANQLVQSTGYLEGLRLEVGYGYGAFMSAPLGAFKRIRVRFSGLTEVLNFNILAFTGNRYGQNACNVLPHAGPFVVEFPFDGFTQPGGPIDFNNLNHLDFIFQSGSAVGGVSFGVSKIEVSDTPLAGAIQCNFAQAIAGS